MKICNLLITILLCNLFSTAYAKNWFPVGKVGAKTTWAEEIKCKSIEGQECFETSGKDMRKWMVGLVDDLTRPNLRAAEDSPVKLDCLDFEDCRDKAIDPNGDSNFDDRVCLSDGSQEKWDILANWPGVTGVTGPWFIWCQKNSGTFQQKNSLVADGPGTISADAEDAQKASDKTSRANAKVTRDVSLQSCVQDSKNPTLTPTQTKDCVNAIVRELLGDKVSVGDL